MNTNAKPANPLSVAEPWDLVAEGYDVVTRPMLTPYSARAVELLELRGSERALDVAAGPGTTTFLLAPRVAHVVATDFAPSMLEACLRRREALGVSNVEVRHADGQALPFEAGEFDVAVSMFGLMFFPDRRRGFAELHRVLVGGGRAAVSSWAPVHRSSAMRLLFGALRAMDPSRPEPQADIESLENPAVLEREMRDAGFRDVRVVEVEAAIDEVSSPEEFWAATVRGTAPLVLLRRRLGEVAWQDASERALAHLRREWKTPMGLSSVAHLAVASK